MSAKPVIILGTLDTKGEELALLRQQIRQAGHHTIVLDLSTKEEPYFEPDINAEQVASVATEDLARIKASKDTASSSQVMIKGAVAILKQLDSEGKLGGVISIGGASGTTMATSIMQELPVWHSQSDGFQHSGYAGICRPIFRHQGPGYFSLGSGYCRHEQPG